jgi:hypothetical protein
MARQVGRSKTLEVDHGQAIAKLPQIGGKHQRLPVEEGAAAPVRTEALVAYGVENDAKDRLAAFEKGKGYGKDREPACIVAGSVKRVETPNAALGLIEQAPLLVDGHLLCEHRRTGETLPQLTTEVALDRQIGVRDEAAVRLVPDRDAAEARHDLGLRGGAQEPAEMVELWCHGNPLDRKPDAGGHHSPFGSRSVIRAAGKVVPPDERSSAMSGSRSRSAPTA